MEELTSVKRGKGTWPQKTASVVAVGLSLFQLYTAFFGVLESTLQRSIHLTFVLVMVFLVYAPGSRLGKSRAAMALDAVIAILAVASYGYVITHSEQIASRLSYVTPLSPMELIFGVLGILVLMEAGRRVLGTFFLILLVVFAAYIFLGPYLGGALSHKGYPLMWAVDHIFYTREGIFGTPLGVSATYIFIFLLFGSFLEKSGAGEFFIKMAVALTGRFRGGPAKTSVISSALLGTISGSAVANVVTDGVFTIPMMIKTGYPARFAGAVEAVASTGGQIMPPVMGAAAFIMSEFTGIPYLKIAAAAAIPAVLYFLSVFWQVDFRAAKLRLMGLGKEEIPSIRQTLKEGYYYIIPIIVIIFFLVVGYTPLKAGVYSLITIWLSTLFNPKHRLNLRMIWAALENAGRIAVEVAVACAAAGIIVGVISLTGLGLKLSAVIMNLAGTSLPLALLFTMVTALILGMGMPTTPAYLIQAALIIPTLIKLGVQVLPAHMFAFYFATISAITPPVALAAYAAAGISGDDPFKTGYTAWKLGLAAFIVPYMFVYGPSLLLMGGIWQILFTFISAATGIIALAGSLEGWLLKKASMWQRVLLFGAALGLIDPRLVTSLIGAVLVVVVLLAQIWQKRAKDRQGTSQAISSFEG